MIDLVNALDYIPNVSVFYVLGLFYDMLLGIMLMHTSANVLTDRSLIPLAQRLGSMYHMTKLSFPCLEYLEHITIV